MSNIIEENGFSINCVLSSTADNALDNFVKQKSVYQKLKQLNEKNDSDWI